MCVHERGSYQTSRHACLSLKELLEDRSDLVEAFFTKDSFCEEDFLQMDYLFNKFNVKLGAMV